MFIDGEIIDLETAIGISSGLLGELRWVPEALRNLFLPTEDPKYTQELGYYRQCEWRIIENFALNGQWPFRNPSEDEKSQLVTKEPFFEKLLNHPELPNVQIVDQCKYYSELGGKPVMSHVRRIIVPPEAVGAARGLCAEAGFNHSSG
jgi:hypothetical protein